MTRKEPRSGARAVPGAGLPRVAIILGSIVVAYPATGQDAAPVDPPAPATEETLLTAPGTGTEPPPERWIDLFARPSGLGSLFDTFHRGVSDTLVDTVSSIDRFFGAERLEEDPRVAQLRLRSTTTIAEKGEVDHALRTRARIPLPRTSRRLQMIITDVDDDAVDLPGASEAELEERESFAGLGFALDVSREFFSALEVGGRVRPDFEPEVRLRFQGRHRAGEWGIRTTETILWNEEEEFAQVTRLALERAIGPTAFLRSRTRGEWGETTRGVELEHAIGTGIALGPRLGFGFDIAGAAHTRPSWIIDEWSVSARLRRQLHPRGVYLEIAPIATFPRRRDYEFTPFLQVTVEITFGGAITVEERRRAAEDRDSAVAPDPIGE